jgi:hypothetical protein
MARDGGIVVFFSVSSCAIRWSRAGIDDSRSGDEFLPFPQTTGGFQELAVPGEPGEFPSLSAQAFHLTEFWESGNMGSMKTTLEIDDELYRQAKAHASLTGRKMKDLVTEGLRLAMQPAARVTGPAAAAAFRKLEECFAEADQVMKDAPRGPIAREHLNKGRKRLEKP